jgi:hypothetical protein
MVLNRYFLPLASGRVCAGPPSYGSGDSPHSLIGRAVMRERGRIKNAWVSTLVDGAKISEYFIFLFDNHFHISNCLKN